MTRVFDDETLTPTRKLIMLVIADSANDSGVAFPSINTIKKRTNLSNGAVNNNLKWLIKNGYLFSKNRSRKTGGRSSNKNLIYPAKNRQKLDEEDYEIFKEFSSKYYMYLLHHPHTLLTPIFGVFTLALSENNQIPDIHFIIMKSVFDPNLIADHQK